MTITRRQAREWAVQMLTAADLNPPADVLAFINAFWEQIATVDPEEGGLDGKVRAKMRDFTDDRVRGVLERREEIDGKIVPLLAEWDLLRLGTVERAVLRMGVWEMTYSDVPPPVVVNECVDIVNWFSTPKSRSLVNAVLDRYAKSL